MSVILVLKSIQAMADGGIIYTILIPRLSCHCWLYFSAMVDLFEYFGSERVDRSFKMNQRESIIDISVY